MSGQLHDRNCLRCMHYFITYDVARPRGCRAYGFKARQMPDRVVAESSGQPCRLFSPRRAGRAAQ